MESVDTRKNQIQELLSNVPKGVPVVMLNMLKFRELIRYISQFTEIGLHPSYTSNFDFLLLKEEMKKLATVSNKWIKINRQHYLKLKLPETYYRPG